MKLINRPSPKYFKRIEYWINYNYVAHTQLLESMLNTKYDLIIKNNKLYLLDDDDYAQFVTSDSLNFIASNDNYKVLKEA